MSTFSHIVEKKTKKAWEGRAALSHDFLLLRNFVPTPTRKSFAYYFPSPYNPWKQVTFNHRHNFQADQCETARGSLQFPSWHFFFYSHLFIAFFFLPQFCSTFHNFEIYQQMSGVFLRVRGELFNFCCDVFIYIWSV